MRRCNNKLCRERERERAADMSLRRANGRRSQFARSRSSRCAHWPIARADQPLGRPPDRVVCCLLIGTSCRALFLDCTSAACCCRRCCCCCFDVSTQLARGPQACCSRTGSCMFLSLGAASPAEAAACVLSAPFSSEKDWTLVVGSGGCGCK